MNLPHELTVLLFGAITLALLAWPFYPAWREWRHPSDDQALEVKDPQHALQSDAGARDEDNGSTAPSASAPACERAQRQLLMHLPHAQPWGDQGWRVHGDCHLPDDSRLPGPLVVTGKLTCGARSLVEGDVKVHGDAHLAPSSLLMGALFPHSDLGRRRTGAGAGGGACIRAAGATHRHRQPGATREPERRATAGR